MFFRKELSFIVNQLLLIVFNAVKIKKNIWFQWSHSFIFFIKI